MGFEKGLVDPVAIVHPEARQQFNTLVARFINEYIQRHHAAVHHRVEPRECGRFPVRAPATAIVSDQAVEIHFRNIRVRASGSQVAYPLPQMIGLGRIAEQPGPLAEMRAHVAGVNQAAAAPGNARTRFKNLRHGGPIPCNLD